MPRTRGDVALRHAPIELRATADGPEGILEGYASVYDVEYRIGYNLKEEIAPAAFRASLAANDGIIPIFYMHDWDNPIGFAAAVEDAHGVHVTATLFVADNERARSVWLASRAKALRQWSIGFYPTEIASRMDDASGQEIERVTEADLAEASIVVRGANPATEMLAVRKRAERASVVSPVLDALRVKAALAVRDSDSDEDPGAVAQALDAMIDLIFDEVSEGDMDPESLVALLTALDVVVDHLLDLLGVNDPGEEEESAAPTYPSYFAENFEHAHVRELIREQLAKN
jgi:HK97 family phage prohead protease